MVCTLPRPFKGLTKILFQPQYWPDCERRRRLSEPQDIELEFEDDELLEMCRAAHELNITLNHYIERAISLYLIKELQAEVARLKESGGQGT